MSRTNELTKLFFITKMPPDIIIRIEGVTFKDVEEEGSKPFEIESDCYYNFQEIAKSIIESGYVIKAWKMFG